MTSMNFSVKEDGSKESTGDLSALIKPIKAKAVKNGQWIIDSKSGHGGLVCKLVKSKTGKHGHCKVTYEVRMPHTGKVSAEMFEGKRHLKQPLISKVDYLVSHVDTNGELVCFDENFDHVYLVIPKDKQSAVEKKVNCAFDDGNDCYVNVLEMPAIAKNGVISVIQYILDVKSVKP